MNEKNQTPHRNHPPLNNTFKRQLKAQAHHLKAILQMGKEGLTEPLKEAVNAALEDHELLKIRLTGIDRDNKSQCLEALCQHCNATLIHTIGHVAILYRPASPSTK